MTTPNIERIEFTIIGTGFSGLGMAIQLQKKGRNDFRILEKAQDVGGCWRDNTYPGCCCDIPSHLYSFSFEQSPDWSRKYPPQAEIYAYLQGCAEKHNLTEKIRFNSDVTEIRFCDDSKRWLLSLSSGDKVSARFVMMGKGPLHLPNLPDVKGLEQFEGDVFHSSRWDHRCDLSGKRVAVVGTGASAIQFIPQIAGQVEQLHVYRHTGLVPIQIMKKIKYLIKF